MLVHFSGLGFEQATNLAILKKSNCGRLDRVSEKIRDCYILTVYPYMRQFIDCEESLGRLKRIVAAPLNPMWYGTSLYLG